MKEKFLRKINVFGTEYSVYEDDSITETNEDGRHEAHTKIIKIISKDSIIPGDMPDYAKDKYIREILRHELFHAVFRVTGADKYWQDEDLVQYLAVTFPTIAKIFLECGCAHE